MNSKVAPTEQIDLHAGKAALSRADKGGKHYNILLPLTAAFTLSAVCNSSGKSSMGKRE